MRKKFIRRTLDNHDVLWRIYLRLIYVLYLEQWWQGKYLFSWMLCLVSAIKHLFQGKRLQVITKTLRLWSISFKQYLIHTTKLITICRSNRKSMKTEHLITSVELHNTGAKRTNIFISNFNGGYYKLLYIVFGLVSYGPLILLHQKWSFLLSIFSVNVNKSAGNCRFGHIYWRNP